MGHRFKATLLLEGKTATGFRVPPEIVEAIGQGKKRPPVLVTINGYTYRNTVAAYGDVFMIGVSAEHRAGAHVQAGDEVEVDLELDTAPREIVVPSDFQAALDAEPAAKAMFESLSYSNKSAHTLSIEGAKTAETRQRRIKKSVATLKAGKAR
jgi:hypothetical protein